MNSKLLALLATLLLPTLLPVLIVKAGIRVPARKWAVWYVFWAILAALIVWQIYTIEHVLHVEPVLLDFGEGLSEMSMVVTNNGTGVIRWEIAGPDLDWLEFRPSADAVGSERDVVKVMLDRSKLPPGETAVNFYVVGREGENETITVSVSAGSG